MKAATGQKWNSGRGIHPRAAEEVQEGRTLTYVAALWDMESLRQLIDAATLSSGTTADSLYQIASEEIGIYLSGQRSAEETIRIIQSRVQLFINENK